MIGYDLDGVLVADLTPIDERTLPFRYNMRPLFVPDGDYCIITGRPRPDHLDTVLWAARYFERNQPKGVYMFSQDTFDHDKVLQFKAHTINRLKLNKYIESDQSTVNYLSQHTYAEVIHFSAWLGFKLR